MFSDLENLRDQIHAYHLDRLEAQLVKLARPSIRMTCTAVRDEDLPVGASKLGGLPDLPPDFQWPHWGAKPLTFIGQFKLSEIASYDTARLLPKIGWLYFFYEADEVPWGQADQRGGWRVIYVEDERASLARMPHPTYPGTWGEIKALKSHRVEFSSAITLPVIFYDDRADFGIEFENIPENARTVEIDEDDNTPTEHSAYWQMRDSSFPSPYHFWFGHPWRIQDYVEWEVVTESQQIKPQRDAATNQYRYTDAQIARIQSEMSQWQFLFQIDSDDSLGVMWGDVGTLYVCIPKASSGAAAI